MLWDVYDDITGENYATYWTRAAAQAAVDAFHDTNEIGIEGETPRAVAPVWERLDWRGLRLAPGRGFEPRGMRSLNAGPMPYVPWRGPVASLRVALAWTREYVGALRDDPRGWRCQWCGRFNLHFDDCGWHYLSPYASEPARIACERCYAGAPGAAHRAAHGAGER